MKQNSLKGRLTEYISFTYFNWLIVVPLLVPWVIFRLQLDPAQFQIWLGDSVFVSLMLGYWTTKMSSKFAPWFYKKMGWTPKKTGEQVILEQLRIYTRGKTEVDVIELMKRGL